MQNKEPGENQDHKVNLEKRIIIYDDNIEILTMCQMFFKKFHYQVKTMARCENVINDVKSFKPDLILMDLWIPEIGGEKAVELLKKNSMTSYIPVLLFSANSDIVEICKRINADGCISKPFNLKEFKNTIDNHIRLSQIK